MLAKKGGQVDGTAMMKYFSFVSRDVNFEILPLRVYNSVTIVLPTGLMCGLKKVSFKCKKKICFLFSSLMFATIDQYWIKHASSVL